MHDKAIVHILTKARMESSAFVSEIDAMEELSEKYGIKNVLFYKGDVIKFDALIKKLEKFHILCKNYCNKEDLKKQVKEINKEYEIIFIDTALEFLVNTVNEVKEYLGSIMSDYPHIFRDKSLQRELIQNHNPDLGIRFLKGTPDILTHEILEEKVGYPFILKPVDGVQSAGVVKINNKKEFNNYIEGYKDFHDRLKNRGVDSKELIAEEFIDGKLYSIDYFVSPDGNIVISKPVKVKLGIDLDIEDYFNFGRIVSEKTEGEFKGKRLKTFINSTIKATGIKNTFVHHEFKINSKGELKTIELNGRIGGGRLEIMKIAYGINMYEFIIDQNIKVGSLKESIITLKVYSEKRGILESFNKDLFLKIENKDTVFEIIKETSFIGKEVGLTADGFINIATIKLKSKDYKKLRKDYLYIKGKFGDLLNVVEEEKYKILNSTKKINKKNNIFKKIKSKIFFKKK